MSTALPSSTEQVTLLQKPVSPLKMSNNAFLAIPFRGQATEAEKAAFHDIMKRP